MEQNNYITVNDLSKELGMDRSNLRKYIKKLGLSTIKVRVQESGNQMSSALSVESANFVRKSRTAQGYKDFTIDMYGYFYIVLPDPKARPGRVKLGYTNSMENRLKDYKIANPEATVYMKRGCKKAWEVTAIYAITNFQYCKHVGGEVYDAWNPYHDDDPLLYIRDRCNKFFMFFGDLDAEKI